MNTEGIITEKEAATKEINNIREYFIDEVNRYKKIAGMCEAAPFTLSLTCHEMHHLVITIILKLKTICESKQLHILSKLFNSFYVNLLEIEFADLMIPQDTGNRIIKIKNDELEDCVIVYLIDAVEREIKYG